jgi:fatty acid desaturase
MSVVQINTNPTRRQLNHFGFIWLGFLVFFGAIAFFKSNSPMVARWLWVAAVVVPIVGWLVPPFMRLVFLGMSYLAWPIGFVVSHVVLAVVYYVVLTPIGLLTRLFGYDSMKKSFDPDAESYWIERSSDADDLKPYFRQF